MPETRILQTTQTFKFCKTVKKQHSKNEQRRKENNKNIRNRISKTMPP